MTERNELSDGMKMVRFDFSKPCDAMHVEFNKIDDSECES